MRGSPPLQLALLILGFVLLTVPLARLTSDPARQTGLPVDLASAKTVSVTLRLRTRDAPLAASLKLAGRELLPAKLQRGPWSSTVELNADIPIPKEGIEFFLTVAWPPGVPDTAITLEVEPDGLDAQSQTRWSSGGQVSEALLFHW